MSKLIIVEGPQGVGKTTVTNWLREQIPYTNLYRLSGHNRKDSKGKDMSEDMYMALLRYLGDIQGTGINMLFDRTFITEEVYCRLGYRDYNFTGVYRDLLRGMNKLEYDIHVICLYLEDTNIYGDRLNRDKAQHHNVKFSTRSSIAQQTVYAELVYDIGHFAPRIRTHMIATDTESWQGELRHILHDVIKR